MGRASRKTVDHGEMRPTDSHAKSSNDASAEKLNEKTQEELLRSLQRAHSSKERNNITRELLALALHSPKRSEHERSSGLPIEDRTFRLQSPLLLEVADDERFQEDLQVMLDLDSTLFPMDGAMQEMGVHLPVAGIKYWDNGESDLIDSVMIDYWGRPDLCNTEEESKKAERYALLGEFFSRMHTSAPRMIRSGVFEYAPQLLQMLRLHGVELHVFTHRDVQSQEATEQWLHAMGIPYDHLRVEDPAADRERSDKIRYCQEKRIPVCVDDKPDTIRRAEESGIEALSLHWEYASDSITQSGADAAGCWRELGEGIIKHLEEKVRARARREGIHLHHA